MGVAGLPKPACAFDRVQQAADRGLVRRCAPESGHRKVLSFVAEGETPLLTERCIKYIARRTLKTIPSCRGLMFAPSNLIT
jgi:hypothetical protein